MGLFDLFGRDPKTKNNRLTATFDDTVNTPLDQKAPIAVYNPTSYSDVETIIKSLKNGKTVIVHLTDLKTETAIRIVDMLSGAVFALDGGVYEMEKNIFMFSPTGVEMG